MCIKSALQKVTFTEQGTQLRITDVRVTPFRVAVSGADGSFGLRIKAAVSSPPIRLSFTVEEIGIAVGRDEISLTTEGVDEAFPSNTRKRLAQLLVSRALALAH